MFGEQREQRLKNGCALCTVLAPIVVASCHPRLNTDPSSSSEIERKRERDDEKT